MRVLDKAQALLALEAEIRALPSGVDCIACALVTPGDATAEPIAESEHGVVVVNRFASRERHLLVVARRHVEHIYQLAWPVYADLQHLAFQAVCVLQARFCPVRIYTSVLGSSSQLTTSYPHLHVHVVPVMDTDDRARPARVFSWSEGVFVYDAAEAQALAAELRSHWPAKA
jgi:diadenosine tetraphosphate (Ap4A) HIT family hydrolase